MRPEVSLNRPPGSRSSWASSSSAAAMSPPRIAHYRAALTILPGYVYALEQRARVEAARGHLAQAVALARRAADAIPLPAVREPAGGSPGARGSSRGRRRQQATVVRSTAFSSRVACASISSRPSIGPTIGSPRENVALARQARAARPSIYGDDALGWALARAGRCDEAVSWSQRSLRLGTRDALLWFHRGYAAGCAGDKAAMRSWYAQGARAESELLGAFRAGRPEGRFVTRIRLAFVIVAAAIAVLTAPGAASAHPLGNFTVNHFADVELAGNGVFVRYALDLAEIPTFQEGAEVRRPGYAATLAREAWSWRRRHAASRSTVVSHRTTKRPGAGGSEDDALRRRLPCAQRPVRGSPSPTTPTRAGSGGARSSSRHGAAPPWRGAPLPRRAARTSFAPTRRASCARRSTCALPLSPTTQARRGARPRIGAAPAPEHANGGFESLIQRGDLSLGVILLSLLIAAFWGAVHALTPGHGKALVAGYLVGTKGKPRHAFLLGATVTVTHTAGVFALGLVTLLLSQFIVPDQLYPWLTLASGLLVVASAPRCCGSGCAAGSWAPRHGDSHGHHHHHDHDHDHDHGITTTTTAITTTTHDDESLTSRGHPRRRRRGRPAAVPVGARRAPLGDRDPSDRLRLRPDRRVQPRPRCHDHGIGLLAVLARRAFGRVSLEGRIVRALPAVECACDSLRRRCPDRQGPAGRDLNRSGKEGEYPPCSVSTTRSPISRPAARSWS